MRLTLAVAVFLALGGPAVPATGPARVASLNLAADEILVEILPASRLASVTALADEVGTSNVVGRVPPSVPRLAKADLEKLVALAPDLVVVSQYTDADFQEQLRRSGLRVYRMEGLETLDGFRAAVLDLGQAVGEPAAARRLVDRYDATLADLARRLQGAPRPRVLYWAGGMTAGAGTAIGALVEAAGATNVGRELGLTGVVAIGSEKAFVADPDRVLVGVWPGVVESLKADPLLARMPAVRDGRIVQMPTELLVAVDHHAAEACWRLAHLLHPDRVPRPAP